MPNQYSQPIQDTPIDTYTSQHVGLPLEEMEKALVVRQGYYDDIEKLGINTKSYLGGIEGVGNWAQSKLQAKQQDLEDFTKEYDGQDLTKNDIASAFKQKSSDVAADPEIGQIQQVSGMVKQFKANLQEAKKNDNFAPENIWAQQKAIQNYSDSGEIGEFDPTIDKGVNIFEEASKYFKVLHADSSDAIGSIAAGDGTSVYYKNGSAGISGGKISQQARNTFNEFMSSAAGRQLQRRYQMEQESQGKTATPQGAVKYAADTFMGIGSGFAYSDSSSNLDAALNKNEDLKRKTKEEKKKKEAELLSLPFGEFNATGSNIDTDERGNPIYSGGVWEKFNQTLESTGSWKSAGKAALDYLGSDEKGVQTAAEKAKYAPVIDAMSTVNAQRQKAGEKPYTFAEWQTAANKKRQVSVNVNLDKKVQDSYENILVANGGISTLRAIDPKDPSNRNLTFDQLIRDKLGKDSKDPITAEDLKELNVKVVSAPTSTSYSPSAIGVSFDGKSYLADLSDAMGPEGGMIPKDKSEAAAINEFNRAQAMLKGGSHMFNLYDFNSEPGKIKLVKVKAIPDVVRGTVQLKEVK